MTRRVFWNSNDNWFVAIFSHPILGRTFLLTGKKRGGGLFGGQFLPVLVCTLNKIFSFLQILVLSLNTYYWENNLFRKHCMKLYACQSVVWCNILALKYKCTTTTDLKWLAMEKICVCVLMTLCETINIIQFHRQQYIKCHINGFWHKTHTYFAWLYTL